MEGKSCLPAWMASEKGVWEWRQERGQLTVGFAGPFKEGELYSKSDGKPLKGLKAEHDII